MTKQGRVKYPKPRARSMSQHERQQDIIRRLKFIVPSHGRPWLTTYEIARLIGLARSSKLQKLLDMMVSDGVLVARKCQRPGRRPGVEYKLREHMVRPALLVADALGLIRINGVEYKRQELL